MMFSTVSETGIGLTVYDRNSSRKSDNYRYPVLPGIEIRHAIPYEKTAQVYKDYLLSLNVNTVEDSATMFSRRLAEIIACGGIALTNSTPAVEKMFSEFCYVVHSKEEACEVFERMKYGPSENDLARSRAGAAYIAQYHTWSHRLHEICDVIGLEK